MWRSLYLYCDDPHSIADTLRKTLIALEYELYDPFGMGITGKGYNDAVRLFVALPQQHWVRVLGDADARLLPGASQCGLCLSLHLDGDTADIQTYVKGEAVPIIDALTPQLRPDRTADDLHAALSGEYNHTIRNSDYEQPTIPMAALPDDVRQMADQLNPNQLSKLFNKWMKRVAKRVSGDEEAARELLRGNKPDWTSAAGQRIQAVVDCITLPSPYWRVPDFVTLRDAYQLHARRQRKPNITLYPGERQQMEAVPGALDYLPVYGGKVVDDVR